MSGPPKYFTPDWGAAARSVKELAALEANVIVTGHGHALYGEEARKALHKLARQFWQLGMPDKGRYVSEPALFDDKGPTYVPPRASNNIAIKIIAATVLVAVGYALYRKKQKTLGKALMTSSIALLGIKLPTF
jgi:hypothetical protein